MKKKNDFDHTFLMLFRFFSFLMRLLNGFSLTSTSSESYCKKNIKKVKKIKILMIHFLIFTLILFLRPFACPYVLYFSNDRIRTANDSCRVVSCHDMSVHVKSSHVVFQLISGVPKTFLGPIIKIYLTPNTS